MPGHATVAVLTVVNSAINANSDKGKLVGRGGGIVSGSFSGECTSASAIVAGSLTITSSTVSGNFATGLVSSVGGGLNLGCHSSIIANNSAGSGADCWGGNTSSTDNVMRTSDGCLGIANGVNGDKTGDDITPLDPGLLPINSNGGPTQTRTLLLGSPALGAVTGICLSVDQRGMPRPGSSCDIGVFERPAP